jgi:hypothetical protein
MTMQMSDLAARRSARGWRLAEVPHGGNAHVHLLDERGDVLRSFKLEAALPEFSRFAHWTTAGTAWSAHHLAYFTAGQRHLVVRAWWGARLVVALDRLRPINPRELSDELHRTECELVLRGLGRLVAATESGRRPRYDGPSTSVLGCTVGTLVHFPGLLGLAEAVPPLRVLEERLRGGSQCYSSFCYEHHGDRQLAQVSLRRLGERPRGFPVLRFVRPEARAELLRRQPGPIDGPARHANLSGIGKSTPVADVYRLLGAPYEVGRIAKAAFWRYDVDVDPPYTVLLWLSDADVVTRIVRYLPPFWAGPDVFPARDHSLLDSDGTTAAAFLNELDDSTFAGTRIEVDVLQELAAGRPPAAVLARAVLAGSYDALGPLADALDEADDPRGPRVRSTIARVK